MKKICILLCVIFLCGCGGKSTVTVNTENFESEVHFVVSGNEYTVKARFENGKAEFLTVKPENLKDFTLCFENGNVTAKYKKLTYIPNTDFLPDGNAAKLLYKALTDADKKQAVLKNGEYITEGNVDGNKYLLYVSPSGLVGKCEIGDISAEFFGCTYTENEKS